MTLTILQEMNCALCFASKHALSCFA